MKQTEGGLFVPEEKKEGRKFASIRPCFLGDHGMALVAVATDGSAWVSYPGDVWEQLPALPAVGE